MDNINRVYSPRERQDLSERSAKNENNNKIAPKQDIRRKTRDGDTGTDSLVRESLYENHSQMIKIITFSA